VGLHCLLLHEEDSCFPTNFLIWYSNGIFQSPTTFMQHRKSLKFCLPRVRSTTTSGKPSEFIFITRVIISNMHLYRSVNDIATYQGWFITLSAPRTGSLWSGLARNSFRRCGIVVAILFNIVGAFQRRSPTWRFFFLAQSLLVACCTWGRSFAFFLLESSLLGLPSYGSWRSLSQSPMVAA
jgi:hypothetical protein